MNDQPADAAPPTVYRVLARKYRPSRFADLVGQEAMVRTLSNALAGGRLAHAFMLTGVRGVGKTTTARIIARALNCIGPKGKGREGTEPCGRCEHCQAIAEDRHMDVLEMDAASRTGIDDIRELIEGVRYRPVSAHYKVYIIDEVHMLSKQAFNGLLKTLEEPPEHVVFIFATTEIRKVPITVLSRCQRFDLRRVSQEDLAAHFARLAEQEAITISPDALALIARAADGSVRDGLSLLDQAIAMAGGAGESRTAIEAGLVRDMLGLADRSQILDLFEAVVKGQAPEALGLLEALYNAGADPTVVLQDLLDLTHFITRVKLVPAAADELATPEAERRRGAALGEQLSLPVLARAWQMLLKGLGETQRAPSPIQAAEMVIIRLCYAADLPSPGELVKRLAADDGAAETTHARPAPAGANGGQASAVSQTAVAGDGNGGAATQALRAPEPEFQPAIEAQPEAQPEARPDPQSFEAVLQLLEARREFGLARNVAETLHLVRFEPGHIEVRPGPEAPREVTGRLKRLLEDWTGQRWLVAVSGEPGAPTLAEQRRDAEAQLKSQLLQDPLVQAALEAFPGAELVAQRERPSAVDQEDLEEQSEDENLP